MPSLSWLKLLPLIRLLGKIMVYVLVGATLLWGLPRTWPCFYLRKIKEIILHEKRREKEREINEKHVKLPAATFWFVLYPRQLEWQLLVQLSKSTKLLKFVDYPAVSFISHNFPRWFILDILSNLYRTFLKCIFHILWWKKP